MIVSSESRHETHRKIPPKYFSSTWSPLTAPQARLPNIKGSALHRFILLDCYLFECLTSWSSDLLRLTTSSSSVANMSTVSHFVPLELVALGSGDYYYYTQSFDHWARIGALARKPSCWDQKLERKKPDPDWFIRGSSEAYPLARHLARQLDGHRLSKSPWSSSARITGSDRPALVQRHSTSVKDQRYCGVVQGLQPIIPQEYQCSDLSELPRELPFLVCQTPTPQLADSLHAHSKHQECGMCFIPPMYSRRDEAKQNSPLLWIR